MPDTDQQKKTLLIIEDDLGLQSQLRWHFEQYNVVTAVDRSSAVSEARRCEPEVVLQDLGLPPDDEGVEEGFLTVQEILNELPDTKIIVVTGHHEKENALRAIDIGAYDFYEKPVNTEILDLIVQRAFNIYELEAQNKALQQKHSSPLANIIASAPNMIQICRTIEKVAPTSVTCLLLGESGTGKEVFARAIHNLSPRKEYNFVAVNCAAVPENLMESELFGYEKGAFTGANKRTLGKVETAHNGTLFLDEIGDMALSLQAKLLRFLQERTIERLGGRQEIPVDIRIVCATNKDVTQMVTDGTFREDLYYRISEMVIAIPPLRDRPADKTLLARFLLNKYAKEQNRKISSFSTAASNTIEKYEWPGNIREMENKIKRAVLMCEGKRISTEDLGMVENASAPITLRQARQDAETEVITTSISLTNGNLSSAAKLLGITRPTLYDLINKYDIQVEDKNEL